MEQPTRIVTTATEVLALFTPAPRAGEAYVEWEQTRRRDAVRAAVLAHVSDHVYRVKPVAVQMLRDDILRDSHKRYPDGMRTEPTPARTRDRAALHPLTVIQKDQREHPVPRDWSPPLSFNHGFHILLERRQGQIFTYPEFVAACQDDRTVLGPLLFDDAARVIREALPSLKGPDAVDNFRDSMRWRMGNAYYGFLKELYILASVREGGVDLRVHPLADTLFRTDFWTPTNWAVALYVKNPLFKDDNDLRGRKEQIARFLKGSNLKPHIAELDSPNRFGTVVLPGRAFIESLIAHLKSSPDS